MPNLSALANVPFYGAYTEKSMLNEQQGLQDMQKQGALFDLYTRVQQQQEEAKLKSLLSQSGGDVEKAMAAAIQTGNLQGASKLAPLIEAKRKASQGRVIPSGSVVLGDNNEVVFRNPAADRTQADPEIIKLQRFAATLPEGSPGRQQIEARIARLTQGEGGGGDQMFGAGLTGRTLAMLTQMAPAYEAGQLTPEQERQFMAAVTQYTQPRTIQNPDTGLLEQHRPELPLFVSQALQKRGVRSPRAAPPSPNLPPQEPQPRAEVQPQADDPRGQPGQTVWDLSSLTTGPIPAIAETLGRTPIVGEVVRPSQITQARNFVPMLQRDLVRVLQNNPRFPEGERRAIEAEININPSMFDTTGAFKDRLIAIDRALQIRERNAFETAQSGRVGREERIQAMNVLNAITKFRQSLGVPPSIRGDEDFNQLPPGSTFIDPEGNVRRKP